VDSETIQKRMGAGFASRLGDVMAATEAAQTTLPEAAMKSETPEEEEL
jgi:hypothetical protein